MENLRLIPDPLRTVDVSEGSSNEPIGQTAGSRSSTPIVLNKRKYAATPASLSLSSSSSSSTPSPPAPGVDHGASNLGIRFVNPHPWRRQIAKRPRLDPVPSGRGRLIASSQHTLAPPPVFRRRPPTPFNRSTAETSVAASDQGGGLRHVEGGSDEIETGGNSPGTFSDSDDSLNV